MLSGMRSPPFGITRYGTRRLEACGRPIRDGTTAAPIRCRESFAVSSYEQISDGPAVRHQPLFCCPMGLYGSVVQNMADGESAIRHRARYQKTAVAIEGLAFGAHQADAALPCEVENPFQSGAKFRLLRHLLIVGDAVTIKDRIVRTPAERIPERQVGYAIALQAGR
jgi:hypothetical protein